MGLRIAVHEHPLLDAGAFVTILPSPLGDLPTDERIALLLAGDGDSGLRPAQDPRGPIRQLLRHSGFKPRGRNKPASEYLAAAQPAGRLGAINPIVDACNAVSLHGGLPISVVDLGLTNGALSVRAAGAGESYVFNASGQRIDVGGLICLFDEDGPCANAVKDAQRTKTHTGTVETLSVVWGTRDLPGHTARVLGFYRELLAGCGLATLDVEWIIPSPGP